MIDLFSEEWLAAAADVLADLPRREGVDVVIDHVIESSPAGKLTIGAVVTDGRVTELRLEKSDDPELVVTMKYAVACTLLAGEMSGDAGFMNGALKVEGAHERWMLELRPVRLAVVEALAPLMAETTV